MGSAIYIALDNAEPGFDTFVNGKALSREADNLDPICDSLGLPSVNGYINMSNDELADMLGDEFDLPELEEEWYSADEGLRVFGALREHIKANPGALKDSSSVIEDLDEYITVLQKANDIGAKWRLTVDA